MIGKVINDNHQMNCEDVYLSMNIISIYNINEY